MKNKVRIDKFLVDKFNIKSRNIAQSMIKNQSIKINGEIINKSNLFVDDDDNIEIIQMEKYVSRGAYKLLKAISEFKVVLENKIVLDIGSSTGGFTQVLLENNVKKVYALDVGTKQLDKMLKNNEKVISLENTNFIKIDINLIPDISFITCDVSFISIKKILLKIIDLNFKNMQGIFLLKPQFELSSKEISEGKGRVKSKYLNDVLNDFKQFCQMNNFKINKIIESPILGAKKQNTEYLVFLEW